MSSLTHTDRGATRRSAASPSALDSALAVARAVLTWPLRVHANRRLLRQMSGMSAHELADIGLTSADLRDTAALPLDTEVGQFLSTRALARRRDRNDRWT